MPPRNAGRKVPFNHAASHESGGRDALSGIPPGGAAGGDLAGTYPNPTVTQARGLKSATTTVSVSAATAPTSGQVLTATGASAATWQTPAAGVTAHTALTALAWTASGHTTAAALDVPYWSGASTPAVVTAPASGSRVGQALGWTSDTTIGWVPLALVVGLLGRGDIVIEGRTVLDHAATSVTVEIL